MNFNTEGLILKEQIVGESDKLLTVLTRSRGVIRCFARYTKKMLSKNSSACHSLTYSRLSIFEGRDTYIITEAEVIRSFFDAFSDISELALGYYFCELLIKTVPENIPSEQQLNLILNSLHIISLQKKPLALIKSVFEIRLLTASGFHPNILYCENCGRYEADFMYFDFVHNRLICTDCLNKVRYNENDLALLSNSALKAFRYCIVAEPKKIFSFNLTGNALSELGICTEKLSISSNQYYCPTLDFYKSVLNI